MGVEPMTCRLRIGCSTSKLRWRSERRENNSRSVDRQIDTVNAGVRSQELQNGFADFRLVDGCKFLRLALD
jgi:hypothetical protein